VNRRTFLAATTGAAAAALIRPETKSAHAAAQPFQLNYAPHFNMFRAGAGRDEIDQIRFMHDQGFRALEDNGLRGKPVGLQAKIGDELARLDMTMGVFVASADFENVNFASADPAAMEPVLAAMRDSVEVAKRVNARWVTVVPGRFDPGLEWAYQTALVIDNLKRCAEILEPAGLVMVLEPLNPWRDHPGLFLTKIPQAYQICRAVGSPSCKILDDLYHQQITEGNLIPNIDHAWDEIAYFQVGDNPGRKEPTTGEINYRNVFKHIHAKGFTGVVGMEHGNSIRGAEGEQAVIDAYRYCDDF